MGKNQYAHNLSARQQKLETMFNAHAPECSVKAIRRGAERILKYPVRTVNNAFNRSATGSRNRVFLRVLISNIITPKAQAYAGRHIEMQTCIYNVCSVMILRDIFILFVVVNHNFICGKPHYFFVYKNVASHIVF